MKMIANRMVIVLFGQAGPSALSGIATRRDFKAVTRNRSPK
jgi:hypothetical protein